MHHFTFDSVDSQISIGKIGRAIGSATEHAGKERCNNYVYLVALTHRIPPTVSTNGTANSGQPRATQRKTAEAK